MDIMVGRIGRPHGLRGDVTIAVGTQDPDERFAPGAVLDSDRGPLTVATRRRSGGLLLVRFAGVDDRDAAEALRGTSLTVPAETLPEVDDPDEFYDHQLIGLGVRDAAGRELGEVIEVWHPPAAPVLLVRRPDGTDEAVPFVRALVPTVDLAGGFLVVDPPDGMFA
ncbi:MAG TPA: ribosome maturation factor RimM [Nakamurella sp.]